MGRPIKLELTAGQVHDGQVASGMTADLGEGDILLAGKAYDGDAAQFLAEQRGAWANIPPKRNRKQTVAFSKWVYRQRNLVQRFFNKLKQFRGIATRYDKNPLNFMAGVKLASPFLRAFSDFRGMCHAAVGLTFLAAERTHPVDNGAPLFGGGVEGVFLALRCGVGLLHRGGGLDIDIPIHDARYVESTFRVRCDGLAGVFICREGVTALRFSRHF